MALTSANKVITSALIHYTFQQWPVPSTTMAITSASHISGYNICHKLSNSCHFWLFHLLYIGQETSALVYMWQIPSATMAITSAMYKSGYNICHKYIKNVVLYHIYNQTTNWQ